MFANRPKAVMCYICGRQFGTKSIGIHLKTCEKKYIIQQSQKPPKQRRPMPKPPVGFMDMINGKISSKDAQKMSQDAYDTFKNESLVPCVTCGRKFKPQSLVHHAKACKNNPNTFKLKQPKQTVQKNGQQLIAPKKGYNLQNVQMAQQIGNLEQCYKCGRKFAQDRLPKHQKVCKGQGINIKPKVQQKPNLKTQKKKGGKQKDPKWKVQHQEFQNAMKYIRQMKKVQKQGGKITDLPPPPKGNYDHYVQCDYCGRKYAADVAQRHIPKCASIVNKPKGIQKSKINDKYIKGSGAKGNQNYGKTFKK